MTRHSIKASDRAGVAPFLAMDMMKAASERERGGADICHLEVGQPSEGAPAAAIAALAAAFSTSALGYTDATGIPDLRAAISRHYKAHYNVEVPVERIIVTTGSSGAFLLTFLGLFESGAKIGLTTPYYAAYPNILKSVDLEPVFMRTPAQNGFRLTPEQLSAELDGLLLASPANPTGAMLKRDEFAAIIARCEALGITFISDEIYHGLDYDAPAPTALEFSDNVIVINSFSKYFHMTGWRAGWMVVPDHLVRPLECLAQNLFISPPHASQIVAAAAIECRNTLEARKAAYARNRDRLLATLKAVGLTRHAPADGAFYLWVDVSSVTDNSFDLAYDILDQTGVAVAPGIDFDAEEGHRFIRLSFARSEAEIEKACERLAAYFRP